MLFFRIPIVILKTYESKRVQQQKQGLLLPRNRRMVYKRRHSVPYFFYNIERCRFNSIALSLLLEILLLLALPVWETIRRLELPLFLEGAQRALPFLYLRISSSSNNSLCLVRVSLIQEQRLQSPQSNYFRRRPLQHNPPLETH